MSNKSDMKTIGAVLRAKLDELRAERERNKAQTEAMRLALTVITGETVVDDDDDIAQGFNDYIQKKLKRNGLRGQEARARRSEIVARRANGESAKDIADAYGIHVSRVHHILREMKMRARKRTASVKSKPTAPLDPKITDAIIAAIRSGIHTPPEMAKHLNLNLSSLHGALNTRKRHGILNKVSGKWVLA